MMTWSNELARSKLKPFSQQRCTAARKVTSHTTRELSYFRNDPLSRPISEIDRYLSALIIHCFTGKYL